MLNSISSKRGTIRSSFISERKDVRKIISLNTSLDIMNYELISYDWSMFELPNKVLLENLITHRFVMFFVIDEYDDMYYSVESDSITDCISQYKSFIYNLYH